MDSYGREDYDAMQYSATIPDQSSWRRGGPQTEDESEEARRKREEHERKVQEVRQRLLAQSAVKKAKKGFLTPDRKKKLRKLLMMKAAEDLKQKQAMMEAERQRILQERIMPLPDIDSISAESELRQIANDMQKRILELENFKYDLEYVVRQKDFEINELSIQVNDLRGKFVKPTLKKVSVNENKFSKLTVMKTKEHHVDFRTQLKQVETKKFSVDDVVLKDKTSDVEWAKK